MIRIKLRSVVLACLPFVAATALDQELSQERLFRPSEQRRTDDLYAQFLYWFTGETVDFAYVEKGDAENFDHSYKLLDFSGAPGFRVGLGYNLSYDGLDTQASYTWFHSSASSQAKGRVTSLSLAARLSALQPFDELKATSSLHYNIFDGDLGRNFFLSKMVSFRPYVGIKGGWINQDLCAAFSKHDAFGFLTTYGQDIFKNNFSGVGPKGGVSAKMLFGDVDRGCLSLLANIEAGFLWGRWKASDKFHDNLGTNIALITTPRNFGSMMFHALIGFGWDYSFNKNRKHVSIEIGYEIEDWLNYLQIFTNISGSQNSDLILQGLNLGARVDF